MFWFDKKHPNTLFIDVREVPVLVFKWSDNQIKLKKILELFPERPLFGNQNNKTHWLVFMKIPN